MASKEKRRTPVAERPVAVRAWLSRTPAERAALPTRELVAVAIALQTLRAARLRGRLAQADLADLRELAEMARDVGEQLKRRSLSDATEPVVVAISQLDAVLTDLLSTPDEDPVADIAFERTTAELLAAGKQIEEYAAGIGEVLGTAIDRARTTPGLTRQERRAIIGLAFDTARSRVVELLDHYLEKSERLGGDGLPGRGSVRQPNVSERPS